MRTARLCSFSCLFAGLMLATRLDAQEPPAVLPPPPEAPLAPVPPPPLVAPEALPPPAVMQTPAACVPSCRAGFTCLQGRCVSSCNPPCGNGEECTAAGDCARAATATSSVAGEPAPQDGVHRHDGFFLRLTAGPGGGGVGVDLHEDDADRSFGGGGWAASVDVGGSNGDNLAIFGRLRLAMLVNPAVWIDDRKISDADTSPASQEMLGVGISYFLMPLNLYLGAAAGLAVIGGQFGGEDKFNGGIGFGFDVEIGKEWWIANDWGLGAALRGSFATAGGGDDLPEDTQLGAIFIAALLSATYQ